MNRYDFVIVFGLTVIALSIYLSIYPIETGENYPVIEWNESCYGIECTDPEPMPRNNWEGFPGIHSLNAKV